MKYQITKLQCSFTSDINYLYHTACTSKDVNFTLLYFINLKPNIIFFLFVTNAPTNREVNITNFSIVNNRNNSYYECRHKSYQ